MIDALIKIVDRLISLQKIRTDRREKLFNRILEPALNDLLLIHGDYLAMFEEIDQMLLDKRTESKQSAIETLKSATDLLRQRRIQFEPVRVKLRELLSVIENQSLGEEEEEYLHAIVSYFPRGGLRGRRPSSQSAEALTRMELLLEQITEDQLDDDPDFAQLITYIRKTLVDQKQAWSDVCVAFAKLKIAIHQS